MDACVLIVIPAYNEEGSIAAVIMSLRNEIPAFDRVVVNDGSADRTGQIIWELGEKEIALACNLGYGHALQTGLQYAIARGYNVVVSMDADGQHRAEDVQRLVEVLNESGADMVIGSRYCDGSPYRAGISRRIGQLLFSHLTRLLIGHRIYDTSSGFKAMRISTCEAIVGGVFMDIHIETIIQLSMAGFRIVETPVVVRERTSGRSMHSVASIFHYPLKTILLTMAAIMDALVVRRTR